MRIFWLVFIIITFLLNESCNGKIDSSSNKTKKTLQEERLQEKFKAIESTSTSSEAFNVQNDFAQNSRIEEFIKNLKHNDPLIRSAAAASLLDIGKPAVEPLIIALNDENLFTQVAAAYILGKIKDTRAIEPLISALYKEKDVHIVAAGALIEIGRPAAESLVAALRDTEIQFAVAEILKEIGRPAAEPLIAALKDNNIQIIAARILTEIGSPVVNPLIYALNAKEKEISILSSLILADIGDSAVEPLTSALKNDSSLVRKQAVWILGKIGSNRAVEPLKNVVQNDSNDDVRKEARVSLEKINKR